DSETATRYSNKLARSICSGSLHLQGGGGRHGGGPPDGGDIGTVLTDSKRVEVSRRATGAAAAVGLAVHGPFAALAPLPSASEPLPCRLSTQDLVELLKMPTCFDKDRQAVLEHLGNRYGRPFANHW